MSADPELLALWTRGWALTRGVSAPVWDRSGWRIEVGAPDQLRRFIFAEADGRASERAALVREPNVFLKVCAEASDVQPLLPTGWLIRTPGFLMTLEGQMPRGRAPDGIETVFETVGSVLFCRLALDGAEAARGRAVVVDGVTIFDRIAVDEAWRRRGLGREVMRRLQVETGSDRRGVLVATRDGRALYETLGWRLHSAYTTAASPGSL